MQHSCTDNHYLPLIAVHASSFVLCFESSVSVTPLGVPPLQENSSLFFLQRRIQSKRLHPLPSFGFGFGILPELGMASQGLAGVSVLLTGDVELKLNVPSTERVIGGLLVEGLDGGVECVESLEGLIIGIGLNGQAILAVLLLLLLVAAAGYAKSKTLKSTSEMTTPLQADQVMHLPDWE